MLDSAAQELAWSGVTGQAHAVRSGQVSSVELTGALLERVERVEPGLGAFSEVLADRALAEAAARDADTTRRAELGPLHGVPVALKAEQAVAGAVTTFGGRGNSTPAAEDGHVAARLRAAGAVVLGITAMPEFGQWPFTESALARTRNPWDRSRSPGGSSGGSAAAVAAGLVAVGMGGDGGGSIRIPAACCGLFGLKPTRGRVGSAPMPHLWWALGTSGPITRSVRDSALVYDVVRGSGPGDRFTAPDTGSFLDAAEREPGRLRVGWSVRPPVPGVPVVAEHVRAVEETAALLADLGHDVAPAGSWSFDATTAFVPQFFGAVRAEAAAVEHPDRLEPRTRSVLRLGRWATDRVVEVAIARGERAATTADRVFERCDVLLTPTLAARPPKVGILDGAGAVRAMLRAQPMIAFTAPWNVTGHPAASVPAGFAGDGLPLAVQLVARRGDEATLLSLSAQLEAARPWAQHRPNV